VYINTSGLILRETAYKDSSKILTVLTAGEGKLTASARGALRKNSKLAAATQLLVFSDMTLFQSRDRWTLTEARSVEQFIGLRGDIKLLALGTYFAELAEAASDEDNPTSELLSLCLNALYALSEGLKTPEYIKAVFEIRLTSLCGFKPLVSNCDVCGTPEAVPSYINITGGKLRCDSCAPGGGNLPGALRLGAGALSAVRYILGSDLKRLFSFKLGDDALRELSLASELYLLAHLERGFRTLDYYKKIKNC
jgi:DNA repair protein RecO (recombination protein O)